MKYIYIYIYIYRTISLVGRAFANDPEFNPRSSYTKDKKIVLDTSFLNIQYYKVLIKGKVKEFWEVIVPAFIFWCSSYWKGSLRFTLDCLHQLYLLIPISVCMCVKAFVRVCVCMCVKARACVCMCAYINVYVWGICMTFSSMYKRWDIWKPSTENI